MSTIKVTEHKAEPVPAPVDTYTISGLTIDHLRVIHCLTGRVDSQTPLREFSSELWCSIGDRIKGTPSLWPERACSVAQIGRPKSKWPPSLVIDGEAWTR